MTNIVMVTNCARPKLIHQALESLRANTPSGSATLTLINEGPHILGEHANDQYCVLNVKPPCRILSRLKNLGVYWAEKQFGRGDWLVMVDDDVCFLPGWLERLTDLAKATETANYRLWGGQVHPYHHPILQQGLRGVDEYTMLDGPAWLMRWETWDTLGGLRGEAEGVCKGEDCDFCDRLKSFGGRIGVPTEHVVIHTGLTNSEGQDAPGRKEREALIPIGVIAE